MTIYVWKGSTAGGGTLENLLDDGSNAANFHWNYPGNWYEQKFGSTAGSTSGKYFVETNKVPGFFDTAAFETISTENFGAYGIDSATGAFIEAQALPFGVAPDARRSGIPLCSCKFGGKSQYQDATGTAHGFVNANHPRRTSASSQVCEIRIRKNSGFSGNPNSLQSRGTTAGSFLGASPAEREILRSNGIGTNSGLTYGGVNMGGTVDSLRVESKFYADPQGDFTAKFADSHFHSYGVGPVGAYPCGDFNLDFAGGTAFSGRFDRRADNSDFMGNSIYRFRHDTFANYTGHTGHKLNISSVYVGDASKDSYLYFESDTAISYFGFTPRYRPKTCKINADVIDLNVAPEAKRSLISGGRPPYYDVVQSDRPYNTLILSGGSDGANRNITRLHMLKKGFGLQHGSTVDTNILDGKYNEEYDLGDQYDSNGVDPRNPAEIKGANNLVGFENGTFVVEQLAIQGGRLIVGDWNLGISGEASGRKGLMGRDHTITINSGEVHNAGTIDTRHPTNRTFKGFKIGEDDTHPRDDGGIQFIGDDGDVILSDDQFIVLDMVSGGTGATYDYNYILPE